MEREEYQAITDRSKQEYSQLHSMFLYDPAACKVEECRLANDEIMYFKLLGIEGRALNDTYKQLLSALYYMGISMVFHVKVSEGRVSFFVGAEKRHIQLVVKLMRQQLSVSVGDEVVDFSQIYSRSYACIQVLVGDCGELSEDVEYGVWDRIMRFSSAGLNASVVIAISPLEEAVVKKYFEVFSEAKAVLDKITSRQTTIRDERETVAFNDSDAVLTAYKELIAEYVEKYTSAVREGMFNCSIKVYTDEKWENDLVCGAYLSALRNESLTKGLTKVNTKGGLGYNDHVIVTLQDCAINGKKIKLPVLSCFHITSEVAQLISLPRTDIAGFYKNEVPQFDINRSIDQGLYIGDIICGGCEMGKYLVPFEDLNRHIFVPGMTGSGKTNTIKCILRGLYDANIPWLVIEPAKAEYFEMYQLGVNNLSIFAAGSHEPGFYINPFEPVNREVPLQEHVDSLYAALMASYTWTAPMPYVMENAIYRLYEEFGFDFYDESKNEGLAYPTIESLYWFIPQVVEEMNYDGRMKTDVISSIQARISTLRKGTKGAILNIAKSSDWEQIFQSNSIVELEQIKDNDTKAFIMSLICILLREYRMQQKDSQLEVKHFMLIEEAHRLLKNCGSTGDEGSNPRAAGVEFFSDMLAELRSKGQGFIMADQIPEQLTQGVMRNTNLKIVHRLVSGADSKLLGETMRCTQEQVSYISVLKRGEALVFSEGDFGVKLVRMPNAGRYLQEARKMMAKSEVGRICASGMSEVQICLYNQSPYISFSLIEERLSEMSSTTVEELADQVLDITCDEEFEEYCMDILIRLKRDLRREGELEEAFWTVIHHASEKLDMSLKEEYDWIFRTKRMLRGMKYEHMHRDE